MKLRWSLVLLLACVAVPAGAEQPSPLSAPAAPALLARVGNTGFLSVDPASQYLAFGATYDPGLST